MATTIGAKRFDEMYSLISCDVLCENRARGIIEWKGKLYVATSGHSGKEIDGVRKQTLCLTECILAKKHVGEAYTYGELSAGDYFRDRSRPQKFGCRGEQYVLSRRSDSVEVIKGEDVQWFT